MEREQTTPKENAVMSRGIRRILGLESELYPTLVIRDGKRIQSVKTDIEMLDGRKTVAVFMMDYLKDLYGKEMDDDKGGGIFLPHNGILFYPDCGGTHLEAVTPECSDPKQIAAYVAEFRRFMAKIIAEFNVKMQRLEGGTVSMLHNSCDLLRPEEHMMEGTFCIPDDAGTRGAHESYAIRKKPGFHTTDTIENWVDQNGRYVIAHQISRPIFCGNGNVFPLLGSGYLLSQRAKYITCDVAGTSINSSRRPFITVKSGNLSLSTDSLRLHINSGDANISEINNFLKFATTSIVLSMIEDGFLAGKPGILVADDHAAVLRAVCNDVFGKEPVIGVTMRNGNVKYISAVEHQLNIYACAGEYFKHKEMFPWEKEAMELWGFILGCYLAGDFNALSTRVDAHIKRAACMRYKESHGISADDWNAKALRLLDLRYHELSDEQNLYQRLDRQGRIAHLAMDEERKLAESHVPCTRALWRKLIGEALRKRQTELFGKVLYENTYWDRIRCNWVEVHCPDGYPKDLDEIIRRQCSVIGMLTGKQFQEGRESSDYLMRTIQIY